MRSNDKNSVKPAQTLWDVYVNRHFLGTVKSATEEKAMETAAFQFGLWLQDLIEVALRTEE